MIDTNPTLSIVVPLYNSAETLEMLLEEFSKLSIAGGFELILVNDGSRDGTEEIALRLVARSPMRITYLTLSRNFGEHNAILAGLRACSGEFIITMDDDLQNPPSEAVKLLEVAQREQRDVVYSIYEEKRHPWWRNAGSSLTNWIADWSIDKPKGLYLSSFRCISRFVVDAISPCTTPYPYIDGLIFQVTQNVGVARVRHDPRRTGESGYKLTSLLRLWMSMFINASIKPLQVATIAGIGLSAIGFISVVEVAVEHFAWRTPLGWGSLMATVLLFAGTQLLLLGVMGEYIGRIYLGVSEKPQSVIRKRVVSARARENAHPE
jgi:glycosyltransferase involved in cell wall biosynthesis